jgi:hypothetical protein
MPPGSIPNTPSLFMIRSVNTIMPRRRRRRRSAIWLPSICLCLSLPLYPYFGCFCTIIWCSCFLKPWMSKSFFGCDSITGVINKDSPEKVEEVPTELGIVTNNFLEIVSQNPVPEHLGNLHAMASSPLQTVEKLLWCPVWGNPALTS